ncbi:MAG: hypothetical protein ACFFCH_09610 [Promethearchaeota archaeon]
MKVPPLRISLMLIIALTSIPILPLSATDEQWVLISVETHTYFESLPGHATWTFNATRGPNDRWAINFTISGFGFHPTTFLVCDESQYHQWQLTGSTFSCHFYQAVNYSLHTTVDLPYQSQWYCVLNNTGPVSLFFSLKLTHYHWAKSTILNSTNPFSGITSLFGYLLIFGIIVLVIIPCICRVSCCGYYRRRSRKEPKTKATTQQPIIVVMTPEYLSPCSVDEED